MNEFSEEFTGQVITLVYSVIALSFACFVLDKTIASIRLKAGIQIFALSFLILFFFFYISLNYTSGNEGFWGILNFINFKSFQEIFLMSLTANVFLSLLCLIYVFITYIYESHLVTKINSSIVKFGFFYVPGKRFKDLENDICLEFKQHSDMNLIEGISLALFLSALSLFGTFILFVGLFYLIKNHLKNESTFRRVSYKSLRSASSREECERLFCNCLTQELDVNIPDLIDGKNRDIKSYSGLLDKMKESNEAA